MKDEIGKKGISYMAWPEHVTDEIIDGNVIHNLDSASYCEFFEEKIHFLVYEDKETGIKFFDGINFEEYAHSHDNHFNVIMVGFLDFIKDDRIYDFQVKMDQQYNIHLNGFALFELCLFINEIICQKRVLLLKPTAADILEEIKELKSITLEGRDGKKMFINNKNYLDSLNKKLKKEAKGNGEYETYKLVRQVDFFSKELLMLEFAYYLSRFFHEFFDIPRKNGGFISVLEQKIVGYCIKYFDYSPIEITPSRFRQLKARFKDIMDLIYFGGGTFPIDKDDKKIFLQWAIVKYKDWKNGRVDIIREKPEDPAIGMHVYISPETFEGVDWSLFHALKKKSE